MHCIYWYLKTRSSVTPETVKSSGLSPLTKLPFVEITSFPVIGSGLAPAVIDLKISLKIAVVSVAESNAYDTLLVSSSVVFALFV